METIMDNEYKINISGAGLSFTKTIDPDKAKEIIYLCQDIKTLEISPAEYYRKFNPERNPDKILVFASYMENILDRSSFTLLELKEMFDRVGEKMPKNFTRDVNWAVSNKWLDRIKDSKKYYITESGYSALACNFSAEIIKETRMEKTL
jgi:sugar-specific transcriptional regulator TrmB